MLGLTPKWVRLAQMGQIRDFFRSDLSLFLLEDLKMSLIFPMWGKAAKLIQLEANTEIPDVELIKI